MIVVLNFAMGFFFSFIGSIPPGTLNLCVLQLGMEKKIAIAWRFILAVAIIEYPYAWIAVVFEQMITSTPVIVANMQLITAIVMTALGILNLWPTGDSKPSAFSEKFNNSGFRRGIVLSILNPLAIPFWIGTTAYLNGQQWINLSTPLRLHSYIFGTSIGVLVILVIMAYLAKKVVSEFQHSSRLKKVPGIALLVLGLYAFIRYLF
ncbi:LysE family transporter [Chryseolinea lacunae]|uniref:LysE family transporter n=1 Tax=Chryseolinea lacunae TaxID=2801331 RepID=A0ABS1KQX1_9BACT|nr:LysE family transporter [Chryseolinea lacunae]MBL0741869.1 LysE family transporter [Chryseolinea lacunae]